MKKYNNNHHYYTQVAVKQTNKQTIHKHGQMQRIERRGTPPPSTGRSTGQSNRQETAKGGASQTRQTGGQLQGTTAQAGSPRRFVSGCGDMQPIRETESAAVIIYEQQSQQRTSYQTTTALEAK